MRPRPTIPTRAILARLGAPEIVSVAVRTLKRLIG
jgi:hypothetical protein